ncbi:hypothetical protein L596_018265 [Steinernema carpocapsae]|nr:hypothetical protein L596_018265 [Steinernema carpocapsae]
MRLYEADSCVKAVLHSSFCFLTRLICFSTIKYPLSSICEIQIWITSKKFKSIIIIYLDDRPELALCFHDPGADDLLKLLPQLFRDDFVKLLRIEGRHGLADHKRGRPTAAAAVEERVTLLLERFGPLREQLSHSDAPSQVDQPRGIIGGASSLLLEFPLDVLQGFLVAGKIGNARGFVGLDRAEDDDLLEARVVVVWSMMVDIGFQESEGNAP